MLEQFKISLEYKKQNMIMYKYTLKRFLKKGREPQDLIVFPIFSLFKRPSYETYSCLHLLFVNDPTDVWAITPTSTNFHRSK